MSGEAAVATAMLELMEKIPGWEIGSVFMALTLLPMVLAFASLWLAVKALREQDKVLGVKFDKLGNDHDAIRTSLSQWISLRDRDDERFARFIQGYETLARAQHAAMETVLDTLKENSRAMEMVATRLEYGLRKS